MTGAEWLACDEPIRMLDLCKDERKLRLFACACYRQTEDCDKSIVSALERLADMYGRPPFDALMATRWQTLKQSRWLWCITCFDIAVSLRRILGPKDTARATLLREVFGGSGRAPIVTPVALSIARRAYDERDFNALPILADALEDAGCGGELLEHLRSPGPHVLGCWALDLTLANAAVPCTPAATAPSSWS